MAGTTANSGNSDAGLASEMPISAKVDGELAQKEYQCERTLVRIEEQFNPYDSVPVTHRHDTPIESVGSDSWDRPPIGDNASITNSTWTTVDEGYLPGDQTFQDPVLFQWDLGHGSLSQPDFIAIPRWELEEFGDQHDDAIESQEPPRPPARMLGPQTWTTISCSHSRIHERRQILARVDQLFPQSWQSINDQQIVYEHTLEVEEPTA